MAGGHALTRVDSGAMKFRPGGTSTRRPNPLSTPTRPSASSSITPNPSRSASALNQVSVSRDGLASSSDTEAGPSRGGIPTIASSRAPHISITPGLSRVVTQQRPPNFPAPRAAISAAAQPTLVAPAASSQQGATTASSTTAAGDSLGPPSRAPSTSNPPNTFATDDSADPMSKANNALSTHNIAPLLTPPSSQNFNLSDSTASRPGIAIQPGISQPNSIRLPQTPPPSQPLPSNFPVDPDLLEFTNEPFGSQLEVGDLFNVPLVQPEPTALPNLVEVGQLPPPPLLEPVPETQSADPTPAAPTKKSRKKAINADKPRKRRRTAQAQSDAEDDQGEDAEQSGRPTRRRRSGGIRVRRAKTMEEKIEAFEQRAARAAEEGENEEPLDPTTATMASLCESDLPNGRISSKYVEKGIAYVKHVEERRQRILERTAERIKKLRTSGLDPDQTQLPPPVKQPEPAPAPPSAELDEDGNPIAGPSRRELGASLSPSPERELEPASPEEKFAETAAAPQIRFVNGEMVLDEESQFYDRGGPTQQDEDAMVVVDEADSTRFSNSSSFMRKAGSRGSRWTADETEMFYWCLSAFGEDYENIARYLGRTPLQCKNKTKSEDRRGNEKRITMAIKTRIPLDLEEFGRITGRDFSGPPPAIRTPAVPPPSEAQEQEPVVVAGKAKALSSTPAPASTQKQRGKPISHADEEIITFEEYLRNGDD